MRQKGWSTVRGEVNAGRPRGQFMGKARTGQLKDFGFHSESDGRTQTQRVVSRGVLCSDFCLMDHFGNHVVN